MVLMEPHHSHMALTRDSLLLHNREHPHFPGYQVFHLWVSPISLLPPVVCQLCFSPCHSALQCSRFTASHTPTLSALPTSETNDLVWYPDSGASTHMTPHEGILSYKTPYTGPNQMCVANGTKLPISHVGHLK
ncbi:unnamed protein product, partial [Cuscuta europaea]